MTDIYRCDYCGEDTRECDHEPEVKADHEYSKQNKIAYLESEIDRLTRELNYLTKTLTQLERGH